MTLILLQVKRNGDILILHIISRFRRALCRYEGVTEHCHFRLYETREVMYCQFWLYKDTLLLYLGVFHQVLLDGDFFNHQFLCHYDKYGCQICNKGHSDIRINFCMLSMNSGWMDLFWHWMWAYKIKKTTKHKGIQSDVTFMNLTLFPTNA